MLFPGRHKRAQCDLPNNERTLDESSSVKSYKAIDELLKYCQENNIKEIAIPKYRCGIDKLDWSEISTLLNNKLINNGIKCDVYVQEPEQYIEESVYELSMNELIAKEQDNDDEIKQLKERIIAEKSKAYSIEEGVLLKLKKNSNGRVLRQLVVPLAMREEVLRMCHDDFTGAHLGQKKTWAKLNNRFYWPGSYKDTIDHVESCEVCAKIKCPQATRAELKPIVEFDKPFDMVGMDILELSRTSLGNRYCIVFTDYLTKWVEAFPLRNMTADTIAKVFVNEVVTRHSAPRVLLSDQGANFRSELIQSICKFLKIHKVQTAPYNPKCDGLTERANKTLCDMLASYSDSNQTNWDQYLPLVLYGFRTSEQSTTKESPFALLYGREPRLGDLDNFNLGYQPAAFMADLHWRWREAKRNIIKYAEINKERYDRKYDNKPIKYQVGDLIRLKMPQTKIGLKSKLRNDKWSEPLEIKKVISDQNVEVTWNDKAKIVNVNNVKKKERDREVIRKESTITRSGRVSKPRMN